MQIVSFQQRIPKIRDNMKVVTRLREYAERYTPCLGLIANFSGGNACEEDRDGI